MKNRRNFGANSKSNSTADSSNNQASTDVNTTPLYDEPSDENAFSSKDVSHTVDANSTQTLIDRDTPSKQNQAMNDENVSASEIETN